MYHHFATIAYFRRMYLRPFGPSWYPGKLRCYHNVLAQLFMLKSQQISDTIVRHVSLLLGW